VAELASELAPDQVMGALHDIEVAFGRTRKRVNEARILDLDLLTYHDLVSEEGAWPLLPHPRMAERAFVLRPLAEVAPQWRHPVLGETAAVMLSRLDAPQVAEPLD
jgi:2-amino-4-hydroxy-6-hydroxymethyldihydropteridine diphosphokinase